jgi:Protein of unknown function (DUF3429)
MGTPDSRLGADISRPGAKRGAPAAALVFGLGGLIPFVGLAGLALLGPPSSRADAILKLAHYGATIVSFVGALHWGYAVRDDARGAQAWIRYGWSVVPALVAWLALQFDAVTALRIQASMLVVCILVDRRFAHELGLPGWLMSLRYWLSAVGAACPLLASFA